jgi:predicted secreted hydrolase
MNLKNFVLIVFVSLFLFSCGDNDSAPVKYPTSDYREYLEANDSQVEWWYYYAFAEGQSTGKEYGLMASFFTFRVGEQSGAGHYVIHEVVDLESGRHYSTSRADSAFLGPMGMVMEMLIKVLLNRQATPEEEEMIEILKKGDTYGQHEKLNNAALQSWPLYIDYGGDKFEILSQKTEFITEAHGDNYDFEIRMIPAAEIIPVMGTGMVSDVMHYYTFPDMEITGTLNFDGVEEEISGVGWFDHQWQEFGGEISAISDGWRWAGILIEGGPYIHLYQFHNMFTKELSGPGFMTISYPDGKNQIVLRDVQYYEEDYWLSDYSQSNYPIGSRWVSVEGDVSVELTPMVRNMEMHTLTPLNPSIWEGPCRAVVVIAGDTLRGRGFQELNGFAEIQ